VAGGEWALFGNTMAPGFTSPDFEGAEPDELLRRWPEAEAAIRALHRPGEPRRMPPGL
jgi:predicted cupin superfamily sugar epimerase